MEIQVLTNSKSMKNKVDIEKEILKFIKEFKHKFYTNFGFVPQVYYDKDHDIPVIGPYELADLGQEIIDNDPELSQYKFKIRDRSRKRELVIFRQCCYKISRVQGFSLTSIGQAFGRDHATVMYGIKVIETLLDVNDFEVVKIYSNIKHEIKKKYGFDGDVEPHNRKGLDPESVLHAGLHEE